MDVKTRISKLEAEAAKRILILDGAMGTMIQTYTLTEEDFRGQRFADWASPLRGNNDLLNLTRPDIIAAIHEQYYEAGADFVETNTFSATTIAMADYRMEALADEIAAEGARIARAVADRLEARDGKPRGVLGAPVGVAAGQRFVSRRTGAGSGAEPAAPVAPFEGAF